MSGIETSGPTLVVLAAGMSSRYGSPKQLDAVGPGGATLMDYAVFDAARTGFTGLVLIVRPGMDDFRHAAQQRYKGSLAVRFAEQVTPAGRPKPYGTGHALLSAEHEVRGPFVVVNADDFYGLPAFRAARDFLAATAGSVPPQWAVAGYPVMETLSDAGRVNRAICRAQDGWLLGIDETLMSREDAQALPGGTLVSMNMWAFTPDVFACLRRGFAAFQPEAAERGEYLLPDAVRDALRQGEARVRLLDPRSRWFGLTHQADRSRVRDGLAALVASGDYPERLW